MPVQGTKPLLIELTDEMLPGDDVTQSHGRQYCSPQTRTRNDHRHEAKASVPGNPFGRGECASVANCAYAF